MLAPIKAVVDNYYGSLITDNYRYMEGSDNSEFQGWLKKQSINAREKLEHTPYRRQFIQQLHDLSEREALSLNWMYLSENDCFFYIRSDSKEGVGKLHYQKQYGGREIMLFDPKSFRSEEEGSYIINFIKPSKDGSKVLVSLNKGDSQTSEIIVINTFSGEIIEDVIKNCAVYQRNDIFWLSDGSGFFCIQYASIQDDSKAAFKNPQIVLCKLCKENTCIFSASNNPELNIKPEEISFLCSLDNRNKKIFIGLYRENELYPNVYYTTLTNISNRNCYEVLFEAKHGIKQFCINDSDVFFVKNNLKSGTQHLAKTLLTEKEFTQPTILFSPEKGTVIDELLVTSKGVFFSTVKNGVEASLYHYDGVVIKEIQLPYKAGKVYLKSKGVAYPELFVTLSSWIAPYKTYWYSPSENKFDLLELMPYPKYPEFENLIVEEIEVTSYDGTKVPLSIIYQKGIEKNGKNPTLISGYGAFGVSIHPFFYPFQLSWVSRGGILAFAHVRGGGEKGEYWHKQGIKKNKPNTWKDFIACAEYLVEKKYTSPNYFAAEGGSAGGVLVGRAMIEKPQLFVAIIAKVGVMNPLRFADTELGEVLKYEFGTTRNVEECNALIEMDSYIQLKYGIKYPHVLVTAGFNDARVPIWQPAKFAAKLQEISQSTESALLAIDYDSGHGLSLSDKQIVEKMADEYAFILHVMSLKTVELHSKQVLLQS